MSTQTKNKRGRIGTRAVAMTAMLSAVATVLMYLEISVPFMPEFIKLDFSELPALLASFALHPAAGVAVCLIKNTLHLLSSTTGGVGELANFLLGASFVLPAGILYRFRHNRTFALVGSGVGALLSGCVSVPFNYFVTYPFYVNVMKWPLDGIVAAYQAIYGGVDGLLSCLLLFNLPFTVLKGALNTVLVFLIYKRISPFLKGKERPARHP